MTRLIDSSFDKAALTLSTSFAGALRMDVGQGWNTTRYEAADITEITEIDSDTYRSAGKAAAGAIIGGVLTGGVGLLAGAAFGGRRRHSGAFLIRLKDGNFLAFEETKKSHFNLLKELARRQTIAKLGTVPRTIE